jgi:hypothetical protein
MSLSLSPVSYLSKPTCSRLGDSKSAIGSIDYVFLMTALVLICGGCLFMLDLASARSSGQNSVVLNFASQITHTLPSIVSSISTYFTLFLSSILTSGILVAFVYGLRALDQKVTGSHNHQSSSYFTLKAAKVASINQYKAALRGRECRLFLISPVFQ